MRRFIDILAESTISQDELEGRVYGWIPGIVTDLDTKLMRVKARIGKQADGDTSDWLVAMGGGSIETLPEVGDPIGVTFADGNPNRGAYFYFPQSTTKSRPTEPAMLGATFLGMFNYLVTQFNQLRSDMANHVHPFGTIVCSTGVISGATALVPTSAVAANKGKASDGSIVANKATSEIVLSKRTRLR